MRHAPSSPPLPAHWSLRLAAWYRGAHRVLPWRLTRDPYRIWVSEVMLQQTRVETVIPYYERFLHRFPTLVALARAELQDVLKQWEGLGYYSRARNLHRAAQEVVRAHSGRLPRTAAALHALPGFGPYTAAAVASIAFGERVPVVDGNVLRVVARLLALADDPRTVAARARIDATLAAAIARPDPSEFNQGMMELGATVCTPRAPACPRCPLRTDCRARARGIQDRLPRRTAQPARPRRQVVAALVLRRRRVLVVRRPARGLLAGLWEFPSATLRPAEPPAAALHRALVEKTGLRPVSSAPEPQVRIEHTFAHFHMSLAAHRCAVRGRRRPGRDLCWATAGDLDVLPLAVPDRKIARALQPFLAP